MNGPHRISQAAVDRMAEERTAPERRHEHPLTVHPDEECHVPRPKGLGRQPDRRLLARANVDHEQELPRPRGRGAVGGPRPGDGTGDGLPRTSARAAVGPPASAMPSRRPRRLPARPLWRRRRRTGVRPWLSVPRGSDSSARASDSMWLVRPGARRDRESDPPSWRRGHARAAVGFPAGARRPAAVPRRRCRDVRGRRRLRGPPIANARSIRARGGSGPRTPKPGSPSGGGPVDKLICAPLDELLSVRQRACELRIV